MEGLLSMGPTPSKFLYRGPIMVYISYLKKKIYIYIYFKVLTLSVKFKVHFTSIPKLLQLLLLLLIFFQCD